MKRIIDYYLLQWKNNTYNRKSLLLRGARQIGKTYAVRQLGKTYESFVEINLENEREAHAAFEMNLKPEEMIKKLMHLTGKIIIPGKTLLFLDEIQAMPRAILALRYFYEDMPELHVIGTGSLLDFAIQQVGVPVGRVEGLEMQPLSFIEFLAATNKDLNIHAMLHHDPSTVIDQTIHMQYITALNSYLAIGGMPESVQSWIDHKNSSHITNIHTSILSFYRKDFDKYAKHHEIKYVEKIFNQIPQQLGHKFKYTIIEGDYRKRELAPALDLLQTACIVRKVFYSSGQGIPLGAQRSDLDYKVIFLDVGLTQTNLGFNITEWFSQPQQDFINKGALIESFVGQELAVYAQSMLDNNLYYWHKDSPPQAEIDYLTTINYQVIPVEVKSGTGSTLKSLNFFLETHQQSPYGIRFSTQNYSIFNNIHSYPLYAIAQVMSEHNEHLRAAILELID